MHSVPGALGFAPPGDPRGFPSSWSRQSTRSSTHSHTPPPRSSICRCPVPTPQPTWLQMYLPCSGSTALRPSLLRPQTPSLPRNVHRSPRDSPPPCALGHGVPPSVHKASQGPCNLPGLALRPPVTCGPSTHPQLALVWHRGLYGRVWGGRMDLRACPCHL